MRAGSLATCSPAPRLEKATLVIPPFRLPQLGQCFIHRETLRIDLTRLAPDRYRIMVVQNFWIEDTNPELDECIAALFLARRRRDGQWEAAENWPVECRSIALLGWLDLTDPEQPRLVPAPSC
ncbi:hypothetical protein G3580_08485 [Nitrogeniibacter mangrovi]|uniref:Uncharacterized protein n=1 Tax=Nitrogeniibacter mangrovi TaxID=2016596 RepID=A0A6C1B214_9RHOO|nr:hypothetical protein [Nitrogeniibacter mangrovi]QID17676.1 hypothetical protein G3580_08485 [Nitrogeniibacter mangrovi]